MASGVSQSGLKAITHKVSVLGVSACLSLLLAACSNTEAEAIESSSFTQEANEFIPSNLNVQESKIKESSRDISPKVLKSQTGYLPPEQVVSELDSPLNDFTNTFNDYERKKLYLKLQSINSEGLLDVGLVLIPTTGNIPTYDYALRIADAWALGSLNKNNGLLIFMAMEDKRIYILTGTGVSHQLDDKTLKVIIDNVMVPSFKQGDYEEGVSRGLDALVNVMKL